MVSEQPEPLAVVVAMTPHPYLLPNAGKHRRTQQPYRDALKQAAASGTINTLRAGPWVWRGPIVLHVEIHWERGRNIPDWDNAIAAIKGAIDGVFAKIDANDRQVSGILLNQYRDPQGDGFMLVMVEPQPERQAA